MKKKKDWASLTVVREQDFAKVYVDEHGVKYSQNRKRMLSVNPQLTSYTVADGTNVICEKAFLYGGEREVKIDGPYDSTYYETRTCYFNENIEEVILPSSVRAIGACAFEDCTNLTTLHLPANGVEYIGEYAFRAAHITELILPRTVTFIGRCAFGSCPNLTEITLPPTMATVEDYAFGNYLKKLIIPHTTEERDQQLLEHYRKELSSQLAELLVVE